MTNHLKILMVAVILMGSACVPGREMRPAPVEPSSTGSGEWVLEMAQVALLAKVDQKTWESAEYQERVQARAQGASLEGIYQGWVENANYRNLEIQSRLQVKPEFLLRFAEMMEWIDARRKNPTAWSTRHTMPLLEPDFPEGGPNDRVASPAAQLVVRYPTPEFQSHLRVLFSKASPYTVKRILGETIIDWWSELAVESERRKAYYDFIASLEKWTIPAGLSFGHKTRDQRDLKVHLRLSETLETDRLLWEILNYCHRYLNEGTSL